MKFTKYIIASLLGLALLFSSCDLDVTPTGTVTEDRVEEIGDMQPLITGLYTSLIAYNSVIATQGDFGVTTTWIMTELMTTDMVMYDEGYGWFYDWYDLSSRDATHYNQTKQPWGFFYKLIKSSNDIIILLQGDDLDAERRAFRGQALAMRAYAYYSLVNLYGDTYIGHEKSPGVPIVTEKTPAAQLRENPRAEVSTVYDLIVSDLLQAIEDLKDFDRGVSKNVVDARVANGLLARAYNMMGKGEEAAKHAKIARGNATLMPGVQWGWSEHNVSSFSDINNGEWLWGADVTETSRIVTSGIVNYPSHISSITRNGYTTAGKMFKCIDAKLYSQISSTDVRRKAFASEDKTEVYGIELPKYANLKFGRTSANTTNNDNDYPLMRVAEMYLIEAEGLARAGKTAEAQSVLYDFVVARDPQYTKSTKSGDDLLNDIYLQRRIELWGEGFSYFDQKHFGKGIERIYEGSNHTDEARVNRPLGDRVFKLRIPDDELYNNTLLVNND